MSNIMTRLDFGLIGNLGKEPVLRYTPSGRAVLNMSLAYDLYLGKDEEGNRQTETIWYAVTAWGDDAVNLAARVWQGCPIEVRGGYPKLRKYQRADGTEGAILEIVRARQIVCLQPKEVVTDDQGWEVAPAAAD